MKWNKTKDKLPPSYTPILGFYLKEKCSEMLVYEKDGPRWAKINYVFDPYICTHIVSSPDYWIYLPEKEDISKDKNVIQNKTNRFELMEI